MVSLSHSAGASGTIVQRGWTKSASPAAAQASVANAPARKPASQADRMGAASSAISGASPCSQGSRASRRPTKPALSSRAMP